MPIRASLRNKIPLDASRARRPDHLDHGRCDPGRQARKLVRAAQLRADISNFKHYCNSHHPTSATIWAKERCHAVGSKAPQLPGNPSAARKLKILASDVVIFVSVVNTCEAVGKTHGRRTISDRDMRSERPEFERCAPLWPHGSRAKKKESNRKLIYYPGLPGSVVKPETANA